MRPKSPGVFRALCLVGLALAAPALEASVRMSSGTNPFAARATGKFTPRLHSIRRRAGYKPSRVASLSGNLALYPTSVVSMLTGDTNPLSSGMWSLLRAGGVFNATVAYNPPYNPGGYYNGITPTLALVGGDQQYGQIGQFNRLPLDIAIWNTAGTAPLVNAPVLVTVSSGGGWLSTTNDAGAVLVQTLQLTTDANGTVHVYFKQGDTASVTSKIQIIAGGQTWEFTTISYSSAGPGVISDTDGDLIPDTTEIALGMNAEQATRLTNTSTFGLMILSP